MTASTTTRLVLLAHGSRDPRWRRPFEALLDRLQRALGADRVRLAYLESAAPDLAAVAQEAHRDGVLELRLLPLFMAGGGHVDHDIPVLARAAEALHPELAVSLAPPVGEHDAVVSAIEEVARALLETA
jgi:sirohydrochlorin cobaltochelatase